MVEGYGYIGQAGTGKTTQLIKKVEESIDLESWHSAASVLAITFMHGSRRRLENQLKPIQHKGVRVCCQTIDSFCLNIFQRYRSYLGIKHTIVVSDNPEEFTEHDKRLHIGIHHIRKQAIEVLGFKIVQEILSFSYPIVVVDEFQDCDDALLEIIKRLSECVGLFVAADDFQKLDSSEICPATIWLLKSIDVDRLEEIWRTNSSKILDSAKALRTNNATTNGVDIKFAPSKDVAAYFILSNMHWYDKMGDGGRTIAILSPVGPQSDTFVSQTIHRLQRNMERKGKNAYLLIARPFQIESQKRITMEEIFARCEGWDSLEAVTKEVMDKWSFPEHSGFEIGIKRANRLMRLRNKKTLSKVEFRSLISSGIHFANTFITRKGNSRIFLTVHGAKNREFDDVFVLWPRYTLPSNELYLRKLMYNAITRAKRKAMVIAQGPIARHSECPLNLISIVE